MYFTDLDSGGPIEEVTILSSDLPGRPDPRLRAGFHRGAPAERRVHLCQHVVPRDAARDGPRARRGARARSSGRGTVHAEDARAPGRGSAPRAVTGALLSAGRGDVGLDDARAAVLRPPAPGNAPLDRSQCVASCPVASLARSAAQRAERVRGLRDRRAYSAVSTARDDAAAVGSGSRAMRRSAPIAPEDS